MKWEIKDYRFAKLQEEIKNYYPAEDGMIMEALEMFADAEYLDNGKVILEGDTDLIEYLEEILSSL